MMSEARRAAEAAFSNSDAPSSTVDQHPAEPRNLRELFGDDADFSSGTSVLPETQNIGNVISVDMTGINPRYSGRVSAVVYGIYRDRHDGITALDVITLRAPTRDVPQNLLLISPNDQKAIGATRPSALSLSNLLTVPYESTGRGGHVFNLADRYKKTMDPAIFPDIILRRIYALCYSRTLEWQIAKGFAPERSWVREGITLPLLKPDNIRDGIDKAPECIQLWRNTPTKLLNQAEINALTYYAINLARHGRRESDLHIQFPQILQCPQWPNWPVWSASLQGRGFDLYTPLDNRGPGGMG